MPPNSRPQNAVFIVDDNTLTPPQSEGADKSIAISFEAFKCMKSEEFSALNTNIVISAPVNEGYDCLDVAEVLSLLCFAGCYLIVAPNLPNPAVIGQEIAVSFPNLSFNIIPNLQDFLRAN